jgi:hypothetical protein
VKLLSLKKKSSTGPAADQRSASQPTTDAAGVSAARAANEPSNEWRDVHIRKLRVRPGTKPQAWEVEVVIEDGFVVRLVAYRVRKKFHSGRRRRVTRYLFSRAETDT